MFKLTVLVGLLCIGLSYLCIQPAPARAGYEECERFGNGTFVESKLTGLTGQVISHWRTDDEKRTARNCTYSVRFVAADGAIYTVDKMRPYEFVAAGGPTAEAPIRAEPVARGETVDPSLNFDRR